MRWLLSLIFHIFFFTWISVLLLGFWIFLPFPRIVLRQAIRIWCRLAVIGMYIFGGMRVKVVGREKIPAGPALIACKHQSIWETFYMFLLVDDPQYVLKQELLKIPFWGWYADKTDQISVDREAGAKALKGMVTKCVDRLKRGRQVIIFPEGTRTAPGAKVRYHPGVAAIYKTLPENVPAVPVALNSGAHWGRREFLVYPGTITIEVQDPIYPGMERKAFIELLEERIETASTRLLNAG